jgi:hypothetical protein
VPFDPARLRPLDERLKEARRRAKWAGRMKRARRDEISGVGS